MKNWIKEQLQNGKVRKIYEISLQSLFDRQTEDGYLPESFTGKYPGAFARSVGAQSLFLAELGEYKKAESLLVSILKPVREYNLPRIPHWYSLWDPMAVDMVDQIDGTAHCILAYANLCMVHENPAFENEYYDYFCKETVKCFSEPYFKDGSVLPELSANWKDFGPWVKEVTKEKPVINEDRLNLVHNFYFEHSREYRMWDCFDILTQSFCASAADKMLELAKKRKDTQFAGWLEEKIKAHQFGINKNLTFEKDGKKMYLEMRVPTKEEPDGVPYDALGWPCFAPIICEWKNYDKEILINTLEYLLERTTILDPASGIKINMREYNPDGGIFPSQLLKVVGWTIEYYMLTEQWERLADWIKHIDRNHGMKFISETIGPVDSEGKDLGDLYETTLPEDVAWMDGDDNGNGEQNIWFCRAVYRLMKHLGL